jgi:hypothetical protein
MCFISIKMHVIYLYVNVLRGSVTRPVEWSGMLQFGIAAKSELSSGIARPVGGWGCYGVCHGFLVAVGNKALWL